MAQPGRGRIARIDRRIPATTVIGDQSDDLWPRLGQPARIDAAEADAQHGRAISAGLGQLHQVIQRGRRSGDEPLGVRLLVQLVLLEGLGLLDGGEHAAIEQVRRQDREPVAGQPVDQVAEHAVQAPPGVERQDRWSGRVGGRGQIRIGAAVWSRYPCRLSHAAMVDADRVSPLSGTDPARHGRRPAAPPTGSGQPRGW